MNSHLRQKILNKLLNLYEVQSNYSLRPGELLTVDDQPANSRLLDLADTSAVLELIDRRVCPLSKVWDDIRVGVEQARLDTDAKNAVQAEVALAEGKFRLQKLLDSNAEDSVADDTGGVNEVGEKSQKKRMCKRNAEELKAILDLADQAVLHCPSDQVDTLAAMYAFRADVLEHAGQLEAALVNLKRSLRLVKPTQMLTVLKKVRLLLALEGHSKVAKYANQMSLVEQPGQSTADEQQQQVISSEMKRQWATLLGKLEAEVDSSKDVAATAAPTADLKIQKKHNRCQLKKEEADSFRGRSLIATEDLPSGATVLVEQVYSLALQPSQRLRKCAHCSRPVGRTFLPCSDCLSAVYCSDQCESKHSTAGGGHRIECGLLKLLTGLMSGGGGQKKLKKKDLSGGLKTLHVYRQFVRAGAEALLTKGGGEEMEELNLLQHSSPQQQQQQLDRIEASPEVVCALQTAMIFLIASGYGNAKMIMAKILIMLIFYAEYKQVSNDQLAALVQLAFLNARRVSANALTWTEVDPERGEKGVLVGTVLCGLHSAMLNHSCLPNAEWTPLFADDESEEGEGRQMMKVKISTSKRVAAGTELTINYLAHLPPHLLASFADVRRRLQAQYHFTCSCGRCLELLAQSTDVDHLPLQCSHCPGPVLLPCDEDEAGRGGGGMCFSFSEDEDVIAVTGTGQCLLCARPLPAAREQAKKVKGAREALHLIARLIDGVAGDEAKRQHYLQKMIYALEVVATSLYRKSLLLLEDIYAVCKVLHREGNFEELVLFYGRLVDKLLPLDGPKLLALGKAGLGNGELINCGGIPFSDVFDVNIEHLLFWADCVFGGCLKKKKKEKEKSVPPGMDKKGGSSSAEEDDDFWKILTGFRFAYRLEKALQLVIGEKQRRLLPPDLEQYQDFASIALKEELVLLKALSKEKTAQDVHL